jgi:threonine/homoserine/homoserine lactone efflux protein
MLLRSKGGIQLPGDGATERVPTVRAIFMKSFLVAVTNPKGYLFCSALLPQFIDAHSPQAPQYVAIAIVFAALDFSVMLAYAVTGARAVRLFSASAAKWFDRACGGTLVALAGSLVLYRRANS